MNIMRNGNINCTNKKEKNDAKRSARDSGLTAQQEINKVMVDIVNQFKVEIEGCSVRLKNLKDRFAFLLNWKAVSVEH